MTDELSMTVLRNRQIRIEQLTAERDEARARFNDIDLCQQGQAPCDWSLALVARAEKAEADNARLREVLEPFAAKANGYDGIPPAKYWGDTSFVMRYYDDEEVSVTLGNLRKARAALNTGKEPSHE